jgi:hypothetical protein
MKIYNTSLHLKAKEFLLDEGLSGVKIIYVKQNIYSKTEIFTQKNKNIKNLEYLIYEIGYVCSNFNRFHIYKIKCEKLEQYITQRMKKLKELFEYDPDFTI